MADIAELAFKVDSTALNQGAVALDKTTAAAGRTQTATQKLEKDVVKLQMSQKQLLQAQRQLPMQFTDIFVSLASGQRPMQVMLQQGGQLKDVFGGIGPALRGMAGYVAGLINPFTLAAAAAGALFYAWKQGSDEALAINRALINTGEYAGVTAIQVRSLAQELDKLPGITERASSAAAAAVIATGQVASGELTSVTKAVTLWSKASGESADDVAARFSKLADDPVKAIMALNKTQHFLTQGTLDQIDAMVEQGRTVDAVRLATETYANVLIDRSGKITENLGYIEQGWRGVKGAAAEAWDTMLNLGRDPTADDLTKRITMWQADLSRMSALDTGMRKARMDQIKGAQGTLAEMGVGSAFASLASGGGGSVNNKKWDDDAKALKDFKDAESRYFTDSQRRATERSKVQDLLTRGLIKQADATKRLGEIDSYYARKAPKGRKAGTVTDPTDSILDRLRKQISLNEEQAKSEERLTTTERMLLGVQIDLDALGKKATPQRRAEIAALMDQAKATDRLAVAAEKAKRSEEALARLREQNTLGELNQLRGNQADLMGIGRGDEATEMLRRQLDTHRWYEDAVSDLKKQAAREGRDVTAAEEGELKSSLDRRLDIERVYQQQRQLMTQDWRNGASRAMESYVEQSRNIAGQVENIYSNAFQGIEDATTEFITTGKADVRGMLDSIAADITRFYVKQTMGKLLGKFMPGADGGSEADAMGKSASELAASAVPLYGAAAALSASAAALAAAGMAAAAGGAMGSSGGSLWSLFGNMGSSGGGGSGFQAAITAGMGLFGGGRANGGDVFGGQYYRVGENNHPELLNLGRGNQYLIPGDGGRVEPMRDSGQNVTVQQNITVGGKMDKRTATNLARQSAESMKMAQRTS